MLAIVTYFPDKKDNPQSNSSAFANGIRYDEATRPTWNALKSPVTSGSGASFKKKLAEAKTNNAPINTRTIIVAIFINLGFILSIKVTKKNLTNELNSWKLID